MVKDSRDDPFTKIAVRPGFSSFKKGDKRCVVTEALLPNRIENTKTTVEL